jgi:uncharacterized protein
MPEIRNITTGTILAKDYEICESMLSKARGLMFSRRKNLVFVFGKEQYVPLHNFFVFFPIDVIFLDRNKKIVDLKSSFKPCTIYNPKHKSQYVLELFDGIISDSKSKLGDRIQL